MSTKDIRKILNTINQIQLNEDLSNVIDKVKSKISTNVINQTTDEEKLQQQIEKNVEKKAMEIYEEFIKAINLVNIEPTVANTIRWLYKDSIINDDTLITHAFKSIGIDVSDVLNKHKNDKPEKIIPKEDIINRTNRLYSILISAGFEVTNEVKYKNILQDMIKKYPNKNDTEILSLTKDEYGENKIKRERRPRIENVDDALPEKEQEKLDKKEGIVKNDNIIVKDKNNNIIQTGAIVKIRIKKGSEKLYTFGKVIGILTDTNNDIRIRVELKGEDVGLADDDIVYDVHAWELIKDPNRLVLWDADEEEIETKENYKLKYNNLLIETKFNFLNILTEKDKILLENAVKIALMENDDVGDIELSKHELINLFEIILYMLMAKNKGFDPTSVTSKFKNQEIVKSYLKRMYSRMLTTMNQQDKIPEIEKEKHFKEVYNKVNSKISNNLKNMVNKIATKIWNDHKISLGIAFFTVLYTIMNEQKNETLLEQYIKKLYDLIISLKPEKINIEEPTKISGNKQYNWSDNKIEPVI